LSGARVDGPAPLDPSRAESILRTLPEWFGLEQPLLDYARRAGELPTFTARVEGEPVAFLSLRRHFDETAEIDCMAVARAHHGRGLGKALLDAAEHWWRGRGGVLLQVKTLGPSHPDPHYARTREFYRRCGFVAVEEFADFWSPAHPCLLLVKPLAPRSSD
jgi:GNAT superfamily N-acetyltransferase